MNEKILDIKNLWEHRELFYFLTLRDIKVRYKQAILGFSWAIFSPVLLAVVFWIVFEIFLKINTGSIPYLLLIFTKMAFWNYFSQSISAASTSVTGNSNLITKSLFPREILVFSTITVRIIDLLAALSVLIILALFLKLTLSFYILWIIPIFLIEMLFCLGLGLMLSALNVYFRDVNAFLPISITIWLFLTPIIYEIESVPEKLRVFLMINPMTGIIEGIKNSLLLGKEPNLVALSISLIVTLLTFVLGLAMFKKLERNFADII